ncbi:hypothetical protein Efla_004734 [Eimeria flavescens]
MPQGSRVRYLSQRRKQDVEEQVGFLGNAESRAQHLVNDLPAEHEETGGLRTAAGNLQTTRLALHRTQNENSALLNSLTEAKDRIADLERLTKKSVEDRARICKAEAQLAKARTVTDVLKEELIAMERADYCTPVSTSKEEKPKKEERMPTRAKGSHSLHRDEEEPPRRLNQAGGAASPLSEQRLMTSAVASMVCLVGADEAVKKAIPTASRVSCLDAMDPLREAASLSPFQKKEILPKANVPPEACGAQDSDPGSSTFLSDVCKSMQSKERSAKEPSMEEATYALHTQNGNTTDCSAAVNHCKGPPTSFEGLPTY